MFHRALDRTGFDMNSRTVRFALITLAPALSALAHGPPPAAEHFVQFQTGFEPDEGFVLGDLNGQLGWIGNSEFPAETVITNQVAHLGSQALQITGVSQEGALLELGAWSPSLDRRGPSRRIKLIYETAIMISDIGGADYAVQTIDSVANLAGTVVLFSFTGDVWVDFVDTGTDWTPAQWMELRIEVSLNRHGEPASADVILNGIEIACDVEIADMHDIDGLQFVGDGAGTSLHVDDIRVTLRFTRGDFDHNGRIDFADFATFARCYSGADTSPPAACTPAEFELTDLNGDGTTNLQDFTTFALNFGR